MDNEGRRRAFNTETRLRKASEVGECRILMEIMKRLALVHRERRVMSDKQWEADDKG